MNKNLREKELIKINDLSAHLFWDVDRSSLTFAKNEKLIVQRVLDYGLFSDWKILTQQYDIQKIANIAMQIKDLDKKSVSLISLLSGIPKNKFKCYTINPSTTQHWNF